MKGLNISELVRLFMLSDDEDSIQVQRTYKRYLDKIIDATLILEYEHLKETYPFYTIDQLDNYICSRLGNTSIKKIARNIANCTKRKDKILYYRQMLKRIEENYQNGTLTREITTDYYNEILNEMQNFYLSSEKEKIMERLRSTELSLSNKKKKNIINGACLQKAFKKLEKKDYSVLPIEDILASLERLHSRISLVKQLNKTYSFTQQDYEYLDQLFLDNQLNLEILKEKYPFFSKAQLNIIRNKYSQVLLPYLENINIGNKKLAKVNVGYHPNHLKFYDAGRHYVNALDLINSLEYSEIDTIINQYDEVKVMFQLLPLVNLTLSLKTNHFQRILLHYPKIKEKMISRGELSSNPSLDTILNKLPSIIKLSNIFANTDCYTDAILGEKSISKILESSRVDGLEPYVSAYAGMLKRVNNTIPPLYGEFNGYIYESGAAKLERLLIGANCYLSCITPHFAGRVAYQQALTKRNADALIIKDKETDQFVARTLLFRKNNFIVIAPIKGATRERNPHLYNQQFLSHISDQLLSLSEENKDPLDYVFFTKKENRNIGDFPVVTHYTFKNDFPHSDLEYSAYLLGYSKRVKPTDDKIEFIPNMKDSSDMFFYDSRRLEVQRKREDYQEDIKRIKALEIIFEENKKKREELKQEFYFLSKTDFDEVYIGQDWYIALGKNEILSRGIFKIPDIRQQNEISMAEESILANGKKLDSKKGKRKVFCKRKNKN